MFEFLVLCLGIHCHGIISWRRREATGLSLRLMVAMSTGSLPKMCLASYSAFVKKCRFPTKSTIKTAWLGVSDLSTMVLLHGVRI